MRKFVMLLLIITVSCSSDDKVEEVNEIVENILGMWEPYELAHYDDGSLIELEDIYIEGNYIEYTTNISENGNYLWKNWSTCDLKPCFGEFEWYIRESDGYLVEITDDFENNGIGIYEITKLTSSELVLTEYENNGEKIVLFLRKL